MYNSIALRPTSVALAANDAWQSYTGGILTEDNCPDAQLNHAVQATGYGIDEKGVKYYIIRNSWGSGWGESGFLRIERGEKYNTCGVLQCPAYAHFEGSGPSPTHETCLNNCDKSLSTCSCKLDCKKNSNCCLDYDENCKSPVVVKSCQNNCDKSLLTCSCKSDCKTNYNCCEDYDVFCHDKPAITSCNNICGKNNYGYGCDCGYLCKVDKEYR